MMCYVHLFFCLVKNDQNPYFLSFIISGCWYKYTFASSSDGLPINLGKDFRPWDSQGNTTSTDMDRMSLTGAADSHSGMYGKFNYVWVMLHARGVAALWVDPLNKREQLQVMFVEHGSWGFKHTWYWISW